VADFNGAGIQAEGGDLAIERVRFVSNEDSVLAGAMPGKTVIISDSAFIGNGTCASGVGISVCYASNDPDFSGRGRATI
jgi:hypothetical protein